MAPRPNGHREPLAGSQPWWMPRPSVEEGHVEGAQRRVPMGVSISPSRPLQAGSQVGQGPPPRCKDQRLAFSNHALGAVLHDISHLRVHQPNARSHPTGSSLLGQGPLEGFCAQASWVRTSMCQWPVGPRPVHGPVQAAAQPNARAPLPASPRRSGAHAFQAAGPPSRQHLMADAVAQVGVGLVACLRAMSSPCVEHGPTGRVWATPARVELACYREAPCS